MRPLLGTYAFFLPLPDTFKMLALFVPQGWAMRTWDLAMQGGGIDGALLLSVGISLLISVGFFLLGTTLFRRRFAR